MSVSYTQDVYKRQTYTITEAKNTYYGVKEIVTTGSGKINKDEASGKVTGTIIVDENVTEMDQKKPSNTIKYVNAKTETGGLTVTKQVSGTHGDKDKEFHFTVTLDDKTISGKFGDMDFADGVATFLSLIHIYLRRAHCDSETVLLYRFSYFILLSCFNFLIINLVS